MTKSKHARKQRKTLYNLPLHKKRKLLSCTLSKELREKYNTRNFPIRTGDTVLIMRGKYKGEKAKVISVKYKDVKVFLEGKVRKNSKGDDVNIPFHPSNLMIVELNLEDPRRLEKLNKFNENN